MAQALFKHSRLPGCEHFLSHAESKLQQQQKEIVAASVAAFSSHSVLMMAMMEEEDADDEGEESWSLLFAQDRLILHHDHRKNLGRNKVLVCTYVTNDNT